MSNKKKKPAAGAADPAAATAASVTAASTEIEKAFAELAEAKKQIDDLTETAKRALADLQNYRKRIEEEKKSFTKFANVGLLLELLPVLDNFNRAAVSAPKDIQKTDWFKGMLQIEQQLTGVLKRQGVTEMPSSVGEPVDLNKHEPLSVGPGKKDTVIEEFEKGYLIGDKVIRPAKVKVGDGSLED